MVLPPSLFLQSSGHSRQRAVGLLGFSCRVHSVEVAVMRMHKHLGGPLESVCSLLQVGSSLPAFGAIFMSFLLPPNLT